MEISDDKKTDLRGSNSVINGLFHFVTETTTERSVSDKFTTPHHSVILQAIDAIVCLGIKKTP
jgi:hypothetical protein|nr:MAG TPA: hypothetical protein [Caudoviricetes sp.]